MGINTDLHQDENRENFKSGYVLVNDLNMYYEIHGSGEPLVLLHGGITTIDSSFAAMIPTFAKTRQVIAVEQQAHGHTPDIDRPLNFVQMADDTAALLRHLHIAQADFLGYSDGGNVALGIALQHPDLVRKLVVVGTNFNNDGLYPETLEFFKQANPDEVGGPLRDAYARVAPNPDDWPKLVSKVMQLALDFKGWQPEELQHISAPTLVVIGDADIIRPEHAVEMFRLLPHANLAVLPMSDHFSRLQNPDWLLAMIAEFLGSPVL